MSCNVAITWRPVQFGKVFLGTAFMKCSSLLGEIVMTPGSRQHKIGFSLVSTLENFRFF